MILLRNWKKYLIMGDIGINATTAILDKLKDQVEIRNIRDPKECKQLLIDTIKEQMTVDSTEYEFENRKSVILVIGVNGVGKNNFRWKTCRQAEGPGQKRLFLVLRILSVQRQGNS